MSHWPGEGIEGRRGRRDLKPVDKARAMIDQKLREQEIEPLSDEELYALLKDNQLTNFDPVKEAFKVYDPNETGFVDMGIVREFFQNLGYGDISDEDAKIILETADADKDGRIGIEDFRMMVPFGQPQGGDPAAL